MAAGARKPISSFFAKLKVFWYPSTVDPKTPSTNGEYREVVMGWYSYLSTCSANVLVFRKRTKDHKSPLSEIDFHDQSLCDQWTRSVRPWLHTLLARVRHATTLEQNKNSFYFRRKPFSTGGP